MQSTETTPTIKIVEPRARAKAALAALRIREAAAGMLRDLCDRAEDQG